MTSPLATRDVPSPQKKENGMVEVPQPSSTVPWHRSSASGGDVPVGDCVEFARIHEYVWVRDSKNPVGPVLGFTREGWAVFLVGVRRDEFDHSEVPA